MNVGRLILRKFRSYLLQNLIPMLLLCSIIIPIGISYYRRLSETLLTREVNMLEASIASLNNEITTAETLLTNTCSKANIALLSVRPAIATTDIILLNDLRSTAESLVSSFDYISSIAVLFPKSKTAVSSDGCFISYAKKTGFERYSRYYDFSNLFIRTLTEKASGSGFITMLNSAVLHNEASTGESMLLYLFRPVSQTNIFFLFSIRESNMKKVFSTTPGLVNLYDLNNQYIFSLLVDTELERSTLEQMPPVPSNGHRRISCVLYPDLTAQMAVLNTTKLTILLFAVTTILVSLLLAVLNAYRNCRPLHSMINKMEEYGFEVQHRSELFDLLLSSMDNLHTAQENNEMTIRSLRQELETSLIQRCLYIPYSQASEDELPTIESFPQNYVVCYGIVRSPSSSEGSADTINLLSLMIGKQLSSKSTARFIRQSHGSFVLIAAADSSHDQQITLLRQSIETINKTMNAILSVSVSEVHTGLSQLSVAYQEAKNILELFQHIPGLHFSGEIQSSKETVESQKLSETDDASDRVMKYINGNFTDYNLSIPIICDECSVNERTLNTICNAKTGMTVSAYIQQLRLDKASSLLRNTDMLVTNILSSCGYNTSNAFFKAFKRVYGKSPSEYRAMFRSTNRRK